MSRSNVAGEMVARIASTCALCISCAVASARQPSTSGLVLEMRADKTTCVQGEAVTLEFFVTNRSGSPVTLGGMPDVWRGSIEVFVAYGDEGYREYRGPKWGLDDTVDLSPAVLAPKASYRTSATLLYNHRVATAHLARSHAKAIEEAYVTDSYALSRPGVYSIKAVLEDAKLGERIESDPVIVGVVEPSGQQIEIWNTLQGDPDLGYFIQSGGPKGHPTGRKSLQLVTTLERIATADSGGPYTAPIQAALAQYRASVEELKRKRPEAGRQP